MSKRAGAHTHTHAEQHFVKDLGIALDEARSFELALPGLALASQLYVALQSYGEGELGTQALVNSLTRLSKVRAGAPWDLQASL